MHVKRYDEVEMEEVGEDGAKNVYIQWLIDENIGKNFAMRRFVLKRDGHTPLHRHDWEHEVFVLEGTGAIENDAGKEFSLTPGTFAYVPPNEIHRFINKGESDFVFLCMIPFQ